MPNGLITPRFGHTLPGKSMSLTRCHVMIHSTGGQGYYGQNDNSHLTNCGHHYNKVLSGQYLPHVVATGIYTLCTIKNATRNLMSKTEVIIYQ